MTKCQACEHDCTPISVYSLPHNYDCQSLTLKKSELKSLLKTDTMQSLTGLLAIILGPSHTFAHIISLCSE